MAGRSDVQELLLLDDDEDDYIFIKTLLNDAFGDRVSLDWYQKDGVSTEMICSGTYRITMVDYRLGHENGLEVIRKAKEACPDQVVYMVTSWVQSVTPDQAAAVGANGFLNKFDLSVNAIRAEFAPYLALST
ncbi:MAG TPA: response regulator [Anaerolineaceae bacterium]|nr:response regulator [Anaerolineaceae bacterium]